MQTLIGYSQPGGSLGYFDSGKHPLHALDSEARPIDWAGAVAQQPDGPDRIVAGECHSAGSERGGFHAQSLDRNFLDCHDKLRIRMILNNLCGILCAFMLVFTGEYSHLTPVGAFADGATTFGMSANAAAGTGSREESAKPKL
jgi:hypothetical protein